MHSPICPHLGGCRTPRLPSARALWDVADPQVLTFRWRRKTRQCRAVGHCARRRWLPRCFASCARKQGEARHKSRHTIGTNTSCDKDERVVPSRLRYSVFLNHGTCGTDDSGVDVPEEGPAPMKGVDEDVGSPSKNWSLGSSFGKLFGSGLSSACTREAWTGVLSSWTRSARVYTHLSRLRSPPIDNPSARALMACLALHQQPLAEAWTLQCRPETRGVHNAGGRWGFQGAWVDMAGPEAGFGSGHG